ncbi:MAG TPA: AtpZ/AtpI family protein [Polyangia bacterium]|jgi:F0F1-type ATP synthase assembly protein I|nr:AtpZ/AtpI family protein [Polyangia bacterium]
MMRIAGTTGAVGFEIIAYFCLAYLGNYLDHRFHTKPWLMYLGLFLGAAASINALVRVNREYQRSLKKSDESRSDRR